MRSGIRFTVPRQTQPKPETEIAMTQLESITKTVQGALGLLSRAAGSDGFQVDVVYKAGIAWVMCFCHTEAQAMALLAFVKAFVWSTASAESMAPRYGWVVTVTIKAEDSK